MNWFGARQFGLSVALIALLLVLSSCLTPKPVVTPVAGLYGCPLLVTITGPRPQAAIFYTTDGSVPSASSSKYSEPFPVASSETVRAIAIMPGGKGSVAASVSYECAATRAQFANLLQKQYNLAPPATVVKFPDLNPNRPDYAAIQAAAVLMSPQMLCPTCQLRLEFYPDDPIYREISTLALVRVLLADGKVKLLSASEADGVLGRVPDAGRLPAVSRPYFATAIQAGILPLGEGKTIQASRLQTQQEMMAIVADIQKRFNLPPLREPGRPQ